MQHYMAVASVASLRNSALLDRTYTDCACILQFLYNQKDGSALYDSVYNECIVHTFFFQLAFLHNRHAFDAVTGD
jgi:hypothetical protein